MASGTDEDEHVVKVLRLPLGEHGEGEEDEGLGEHGGGADEGEGIPRLDIEPALQEDARQRDADAREKGGACRGARKDLPA